MRVSLEPGERDRARRRVWDALLRAGVARFPLPPHGRIPNFAGAATAAARLATLAEYRRARVLKVNPDAPQQPVRAMALRDGKAILVPTPRLRGGFRLLRPEDVPDGRYGRAASLAGIAALGRELGLAELPPVDLVVTGSVVVGRDGGRLGKGEGYSDLEYAVLRELGHPPVPVVTTVHPLQVVEAVARRPHDLAVDFIVTPQEIISTGGPHPQPGGIAWEQVTAEMLAEMPVLAELRALQERCRAVSNRAPAR